MKIIEFDLSNVPTSYPSLALCLGFFDGLHLGHQKIINDAKSSGKEVALLSFSTPPAYVIGRKDTLRSITSIDDKADILESLGVSYLFIMPFNSQIQNLSRLEFINLVLKKINPFAIYCGEDFRFGKGGLGTAKFLSHYFSTHVIPLQKYNGEKFSSKTIRHLIFDGKIKEANTLLGHPYRMGGYVGVGAQRGTLIGFPTANMELDFIYVIPANGVYMGYAHIHEEKYKCLISIGTHPTLGELDAPIIEVYIIDFSEKIYGSFLFIEFIDRIRDINKYDSVDDLVKQIKLDVKYASNNLK